MKRKEGGRYGIDNRISQKVERGTRGKEEEEQGEKNTFLPS